MAQQAAAYADLYDGQINTVDDVGTCAFSRRR